MNLNKFSKTITQDDSLPAAQAMLYAIGLKDEDMSKPQIGIASTGYEGNPCNMHLNILSHQIKKSIINGSKPINFPQNSLVVTPITYFLSLIPSKLMFTKVTSLSFEYS